MKAILSVGCALLALGLPCIPTALAQSGSIAPHGFPIPLSGPTPEATTLRTGTIVVNVSAKIVSTFASGTKYTCSVNATLVDSAGDEDYETAAVVVTPAAGKLTCAVRVPYEWALASTTGQVSMSVEVLASTSLQLTRDSLHSLPTVALPANGATTTMSLTTTI